MVTRRIASLGVILLVVVLLAIPSAPVSAQSGERCFPETGQCIAGPIRSFWERNGGLPVFGLPITPQREEVIEGVPTQVQWFERNRLELHPENKAPYDVLLGRLGADRLAQQGRDWNALPKDPAQPGCRTFAETGQSVCGAILRAWRASGLELDGRRGTSEAESLALFGLPLSGLVTETLSDGRQYQVQWFERARFELHPENQAPYDVLLGLLGAEIRAGGATAAPPPAAPAPAPTSCAAVPAPVSGTVSSACVRGGDKLTLTAAGLRPGEFITPRLAAPDGKAYEFAIIYGDPAVRADGTYQFVGALQPGVPAGTYTLTIRGRRSGAEVALPFGVEAGPPSGRDESALPANTGGATANPAMGRRGEAFFTFNTVGALPPKTRVGIYATRSDGKVFGAEFRLMTEADGGVNGKLQFHTDETDPYGIYATTFEVVDTGQKVVVYYRVVPEE